MLESHVYDHQIVEEMREKLATAVDSVSANIMKLSELCISAARFEEVEKYTGSWSYSRKNMHKRIAKYKIVWTRFETKLGVSVQRKAIFCQCKVVYQLGVKHSEDMVS